MPRIKWIEDSEAEGKVADVFKKIRKMYGQMPDIFRTMSLQPDFLEAIVNASKLHFSDAALNRAQHEMIASYVSVLNQCDY